VSVPANGLRALRYVVLERTDLVAVASEVGLETRRAGTRRHVARCCWHADATPSLVLYADHLHCYACGAHGSAIDLVMRLRGVGFRDALRWLADRAGVTIEGPRDRPPPPPAPTPRQRAVAEREAVFDDLCSLWRERAELTREVAGSPALESYAIEVELPELAAHEAELCRRFAELTAEACTR
jgi:DNA primase